LAEVEVIPHRIFMNSQYLIVNPLKTDSKLWKGLGAVTLAPKKLKHQQHLLPHVVPLEALSTDQRLKLLDEHDRTITTGGGSLWSCAIKSAATLDDLTVHLARNMIVQTPHGKQFLLRYFDSRVFRHLLWIFSPGQFASFMGPISEWYWVDPERSEVWQESRPSRCEATSALSSDQWGALNRIGLLNRTLSDLQRGGVEVKHDVELYRHVDALLADAIEVEGLVDSEDQCLYTLHCVKYGEHWGKLREVKSILERVRSGAGSYFALSSELASQGASSALEKLEGNLHA